MKNSNKLFNSKKVEKFFNILEKLDRHYNENGIYKGYDKNNPHITWCQQEVFVNRTLNKWFSEKYVIIFNQNDYGIWYKQHIFISTIQLYVGYKTQIELAVVDYVNVNFFSKIKIDYSRARNLEGIWCKDGKKHNKVLKMILMDDIPEKEYIYNATDSKKYPKRKKKGQTKENIKKFLATTVSIIAKTEEEAWNKATKIMKENPDIFITTVKQIKRIKNKNK